MILTAHDRPIASGKRSWNKTAWEAVKDSSKVCYSTWYKRVQRGESPEEAASYPPKK